MSHDDAGRVFPGIVTQIAADGGLLYVLDRDGSVLRALWDKHGQCSGWALIHPIHSRKQHFDEGGEG